MSNSIQISDFFKNDLPSYAAYDNCRKLCSFIDGQKISMRKIIYTLMKKYSGNEKVKTETVANVCAAFTNYLHGATNLGGVCDTMAQSFIGSNNYPLLDGNSGGFGTRINPTCAANRYTKITLSDLFKYLINKNDEEIIGRQFFEGSYIEPKFFVPIFPILFLNGSHGLSTGFAQDIFPRNPVEVIEYIKKKLSGIEKPRMDLLPWFKNHQGKVVFNSELGKNESFGVVRKNNSTSYSIFELPVGMEYQKYLEFLDKAEESGLIQDYTDKCDPKTDAILFEIKTTRDFTKTHEDERKLYEDLKLIKSLPETLCCIDQNNRVREFSSIQEIIDDFISIRLEFYKKRKDYLLKTLKHDLEIMVSKYVFIKNIVEKTLVVSNRKKDDIVKDLEKIEKIIKVDDSYEYLLKLPIYNLTNEKMLELKEQIQKTKDEFLKIKSTNEKDMWTEDLKELKKFL